jgi:DNA-damage-inducible protein D
MTDPTQEQQRRFDAIKQVNPYGVEYWSMRELAPLLGYDRWERVPELIDRAKAACVNAGQDVGDHFRDASKMVALGSGSTREIPDCFLSRFACYLAAMNGDPRKPEIAQAQTYFVVQTRRTEVWDELRQRVTERVELREQLAEANKQLNATAKDYGLNSRSFGRLHHAGTRGLYGDRTAGQVKARKGIDAKDELADCIGSAELIANAFVRSQTDQKIRNEDIHGTDPIVQAHYEVGAETRGVIQRTGGTLPEDLPAEPSIRPLVDLRARGRKREVTTQDGPSLFDALPDPEQAQRERQ